MRLTGVGGVLSASHESPEGVLHGHSYEVWAWFPQSDARALQKALEDILRRLDHTHLPDHLAWGEALAEHIGGQLPGCVEVEVRRPLERIAARWYAPDPSRGTNFTAQRPADRHRNIRKSGGSGR